MNDSDRKAFSALLSDAMAFYRQDVSKFALSVWWQACASVDLETVASALTQHAMDPERGQFAPKPADIVRLLQGTHQDRSLIAWGKVLDAMQRVGAYQSVAFDDGVIHATIEDLGGWPKVCRGTFDELPHLQRRFCESYRAYARRPDLTYPARLLGAHEQDNAKLTNAPKPSTTLIGAPKVAEQVMLKGSNLPKTQITLATDLVPPVGRIGGRAA